MLTVFEESLKNFWDLNNCLDSAKRKGFEKGEEFPFRDRWRFMKSIMNFRN